MTSMALLVRETCPGTMTSNQVRSSNSHVKPGACNLQFIDPMRANTMFRVLQYSKSALLSIRLLHLMRISNFAGSLRITDEDVLHNVIDFLSYMQLKGELMMYVMNV